MSTTPGPSPDSSASPPEVPVVFLLGGSAARECTVSNSSWADNVKAVSGRDVVTYNLGRRAQTFLKDIGFVKDVPRAWDGAGIVFIGLNLGRFTMGYGPNATAARSDTSALASRDGADQHVYSTDDILSLAGRRKQVEAWLTRRYRKFSNRIDENLAVLERLIERCQRRGLHPVLLVLPLDLDAVGDALDDPIARYQGACRDLADRFDIPFIDFVEDVGLEHGDLRDISHLVEPGRVKWQQRLSEVTAELLYDYGL